SSGKALDRPPAPTSWIARAQVRSWLVKKNGDGHVMAELLPGRGLCSLHAMEREVVANSAKPLKIRRKRRYGLGAQRYYDEGNSSHFAQNQAAKLAKFRRIAVVKV
ncbi:MAG: hypothetical protein ABJF10_00005, partial [Chthoniobacter sp.]|uniref:hypothetical protein n=1 Tax=Chthoniobacter sp. TaxID=2510640 RepID=UPI0032A2D362